MKFSLIQATLGRTVEIERFLESLDGQTLRDFELIVVDQNPDDRLVPILAPYRERFEIKHLRSERGLSKARNAALPHLRGDVVSFPDDDCWYPKGVLERVATFLDAHPEADGLNGCSLTADLEPRGRWSQVEGRVTKLGLFNRTISYAIFIRRKVIERVGQFDETLGLGAQTPWQGAEDYDYILRAVSQGCSICYRPELYVHHDAFPAFNDSNIKRTLQMCTGTGRFLSKHRYPLWYIGYWFAGSLGLAGLALLRGNRARAKYHWLSTVGRYQGWAARV
ncbi:MAG TPA: glycosyltransferase family A protein [Candidatus Binataceae bacterium]|nr:glycosyltransferase family A protein [Candidatus Binataceae bacterium]